MPVLAPEVIHSENHLSTNDLSCPQVADQAVSSLMPASFTHDRLVVEQIHQEASIAVHLANTPSKPHGKVSSPEKP